MYLLLIKHLGIKACGGSGKVALRILNLHDTWDETSSARRRLFAAGKRVPDTHSLDFLGSTLGLFASEKRKLGWLCLQSNHGSSVDGL